MADDDDEKVFFVAEFDKLDVKVIIDLLMTLGMKVDDEAVSDEEFRKIIREKMDNIIFLLETGVLTQAPIDPELADELLNEYLENNGS